MAQSQQMIEPFEAYQIKQNQTGRVISYGTSSYGYDVRCANEFKIFTNVNSTIVDPKNFDERNFVSVDAEVCIIPPNSFVLTGDLCGKIDLCSHGNCGQHHAARTRMAWTYHTGIVKYHTTARENLCK